MKFCTHVLVFLFISILLGSCCCKKRQLSGQQNPEGMKAKAGPPVYIYKTRADYSQLVPVILSADKMQIVSYPGPKDVYYQGELSYPSPLADGYWLDRRGISPDAAFLDITYEAYSQLANTPSPETLMTKIRDKDPFTELYHCGNRYQYRDLVSELNEKISKKDFSGFEKKK